MWENAIILLLRSDQPTLHIFGMTPLPFCERRNDDDVGCVSHSSLDGASDRYPIRCTDVQSSTLKATAADVQTLNKTIHPVDTSPHTTHTMKLGYLGVTRQQQQHQQHTHTDVAT